MKRFTRKPDASLDDLIDIMEQSAAAAQNVDLPQSEWTRLHLITAPL